MLEVSQVLECKQMFGQGVAIREISRRLGISRNTVRRYLRGAEPGVYKRQEARPRPVADRIQSRVRELLEAERSQGVPRKQRLNAARIHRVLREEGLEASERTVRSVFRDVRRQLRDPLESVFLPLAYEPGEDAQVDFMEGEVDDVTEGRVKRDVLIVRCCYSKLAYRYAAPNQTREALFEGLIQAFEFLGGVPKNLWFDNLSPVVKKVLQGRTRELQKAFESFQAHYGFRAQFCRPGKGNEKGGVETEVKWTRSEVFTPIPVVDGRAGLQTRLDELTEQDAGRIPKGQRHSIGELWKHERHSLLPLPEKRYEAANTRLATVTNYSWVQSGTNFYSVPTDLGEKFVTIKLLAEEVVLLHDGQEIARHARSYGRGRMALKLEHYLPLLERKHRGLDRTVPMREWFAQADPIWRQFLSQLRDRLGEVQGTKDFIDALKLTVSHGLEEATSAVEATLLSGRVSRAQVRYHLGVREECEAVSPRRVEYPGPAIEHGSASQYMEVLHGAR